ncbi:MAG TPA: polysaccharide deacetylase family protein [Firmicutes bacterium]|nr:polysaccharide deacetylase family protein [Bacillota bacterium]
MRRKLNRCLKGKPRLKVLVLHRDSIFLNFLVFFVMVFTAFTFMSLDDVRRAIYGVKPGVTLEGLDMSGFLKKEVEETVAALAEKEKRLPKDAMIYSETGELIPEEAGVEVDKEATVEALMSAKPGSKLNLITHQVLPAITRSNFEAIRKVDIKDKAVAFGINVAWGEEFLDKMLETMREENIKATFFFDGNWVNLFPDLTRKVASEGHEIANHGLKHLHVKDLSIDEVKDLILKNEELLLEVAGRASRLFAPPYGEVDKEVLAAAGSLGYRTILWTIDTVDWKSPPEDKLMSRVITKLTPGAIILMHPTAVTTSSLRKLIGEIRKAGYAIVTISDLLRMERDQEPD